MGLHLCAGLAQQLLQFLRGTLQGVCLDGSGYYLIVHTEIRLRLLLADEGKQTLHQPPGVAVSQGESLRRAALGQGRHILPIGGKFPQDGVDHTRRLFPAVALGHLHGLVDGGTGRHLIQKQDLVAPQTQDVADDGLQPFRALAAPAADIVVQQHPVLDHPVAQAGGQRRIPAVQLIFGDGALQAAVGPCVGAVHLHQDLQSGLSGVRLSHVVHTVTCTGWPAR